MVIEMIEAPDQVWALPAPQIPPYALLAQAYAKRCSTHAFRPDALPESTLSTLLWAAYGINRPRSGGRTAPSAHNWQETDLYVALPQGMYRYEPVAHQLRLVRAHDLRALTGTQSFVADAPLNLIYVADFARMGGQASENHEFLAGAGTGCIVQNVYLYCAAIGLGAMVRGRVNRQALAAAMGLKRSQRITLAQTVGLPADAGPGADQLAWPDFD